jgi:hypothetical protein
MGVGATRRETLRTLCRSVVLGASSNPRANPVHRRSIEHVGGGFGHPAISIALPQDGEERTRLEVCAICECGNARAAVGLVRPAREATGRSRRAVAASPTARARSRARGTEQVTIEIRERGARTRIDAGGRRGRWRRRWRRTVDLENAPVGLIRRRLRASRQEKTRAPKGEEVATHGLFLSRAPFGEQTALPRTNPSSSGSEFTSDLDGDLPALPESG